MKKLQTLFVPLMACSFLIGCGGGGKAPETITFSIVETSVICKDQKAVVHLDWTPSDHSLAFTKFNFTYGETVVEEVAQTGDLTIRPAEITITFEKELTTSITGTLNFHYSDTTAKTEGDGKVENINITTIPPTPVVDEDGIDLTYMRVNIQSGSTIEFSYKYAEPTDDLKVYWGDGTVDNLAQHTYTKGGVYHIYITGNINEIALVKEDGTALSPDNRGVTNIIFSNHINEIATNAFNTGKYTLLKSVLIPKTVDSIGSTAFIDEDVNIYCSIDKRGDGWESDCFDGIDESHIISGLKIYMKEDNILYAAYENEEVKYATVYLCCDLQLKNAVIKDKININNVDYPVTSIWESAFYDMSTLTNLEVPESVIDIGGHAFVNCVNLKTIKLSEGLKTIGESAFQNTGISEITLPGTLTSLNRYTFGSCNNLKKVIFEDSPQDVTKKLNQYAFDKSANVSEIILGEGITELESYCLRGLGITEIVLPPTVTYIAQMAIYSCDSLTTIDVSNATTVPQLSSEYGVVFANPGDVVEIKIPNGFTEDDFIEKKWPIPAAPTSEKSGFKYTVVE